MDVKPDIKTNYLKQEQTQAPWVAFILLVATLSGFITYFINTHTIFTQWLYLTHTLAGIFLSLLIFPYIILHFKRTSGIRRPIIIITGILATLVTLALVLSGLHITFLGQLERTQWIYLAHIISAAIILLLIIIHLVLHRLLLPLKRKQTETELFASLPSNTPNKFKKPLLWIIGVNVVATALYLLLPNNYSSEPVVKPYNYSYGEHPFRPSQTETYHNKFLDYKEIATSNDCAACHNDAAKQWHSSVHRQAASDRAYITNISLLAEKKGIEATRYCEGCHAPIALLTGQLSKGGDHGGIKNTVAHVEGIPCLGCHAINKAVHLKGVASYEYKPPTDYLFSQYDSSITKAITHFLIRLKPEQHKADMSRPILKTPELCATCHAQFMDKDMNKWGWVKMQDDYTAWLNSPYSKQHEQIFANAQTTRCQDCHMPLVSADDPSANKDGMIRMHNFAAANTMVAMLANDHHQMQLIKDFLQSNKMRVSIDSPERKDAVQTELALNEKLRNQTETPYFYYLGETAKLRVTVNNLGVGHDFPGGTTDINEAWLAFSVTDASNKLIYESGFVLPSNDVDPNAHFYRALAIDRAGKHVWKHDLFNRIGESYKKVIPSGKSDVKDYEFAIPAWAKTPITVTATLKYRKLNDQYARWALKESYQPIPIIDMARDTLTIPVKMKPPTEK